MRRFTLSSIARKILFVVAALLFIAATLFVFVWHFDGFHAACQFFFGSTAFLSFLEMVDLKSWLISMVTSLVFVGILEICICRKLKRKTVRIIIDVVAFFVSIIGLLQIMNT